MASAYGQNRLATGFIKPSINGQTPNAAPAAAPAATSSSLHNRPETGDSSHTAIELSDDEDMDDAEGGISLNVEDSDRTSGNVARHDEESWDPDKDSDDGQLSIRGRAQVDSRTAADDDNPERPELTLAGRVHITKRLVDLSSRDREEQIKYAFYHKTRDQIDLNRPVVCLKCFGEGHLERDCGQEDTFPIFDPPSEQPVRLWISCCSCASKSHLVGDCPQVDKSKVGRWSLSHIRPSLIVNLSLESGFGSLEKEAANRGMRPEGLSIKGRSGRHTAGFGPSEEQASSDEDMLQRFSKRPHADGQDHSRYDRYDGPVHAPKRQRGGWYGTDSFGRRRPPSPPQTTRPNRDRRSPSPRQKTYGPEGSHRSMTSQYPSDPPPGFRNSNVNGKRSNASFARGRGGKAPTSKKLPPPPIPRPNIQFDLPTRKGSSTWSGESSAPHDSPTDRDQGQPRSRKKAKKPRNRKKSQNN